jgi:hypothetical protein
VYIFVTCRDSVGAHPSMPTTKVLRIVRVNRVRSRSTGGWSSITPLYFNRQQCTVLRLRQWDFILSFNINAWQKCESSLALVQYPAPLRTCQGLESCALTPNGSQQTHDVNSWFVGVSHCRMSCVPPIVFRVCLYWWMAVRYSIYGQWKVAFWRN